MNRLLGVFLFLVCCLSAQSQTTEDSVKYQYGPVTILGTRYAMPWIQVPFSLNYLQEADMPKGKGSGLDEVLSGIPGVLAQSRAGGTDIRLSIRGFGARGAGERSNVGTSRGVRVLTNGFPETEPDGRTSFDMVDIAGAGAIEVVRSNASSLYGNASGGVINIMSNTMFAAPYVSFAESFGSYGFRKEMMTGGTTLGDGKLYFSLSNTKSDGWRQHSANTQTLLTTGIVTKVGEKTSLGIHLAGTSNFFRIPGALTQDQFDADATQAQNLSYYNRPGYTDRDERRENRMGRIGITASYDFDENNMISTSAFMQEKFLIRSERNQYRDFARGHLGGNAMYRNRSNVRHNIVNTLLVGTDEAYQDGAIRFYRRYNVFSNVERGTIRQDKREGANNFGLFVQDEVSINDNWGIMLGGRYDNISYYYEQYYLDGDPFPPPQAKSFGHFTPKVGFLYHVSPIQSFYANLGGGIEVPAGNEIDPPPTNGYDTTYLISPLLEPVTSTTIEVGTKQLISCGDDHILKSVIYDVALYWLQVNNDIVPYSNDGTLFLTAAKTERMGLEIGANAQMNMGLSFDFSITASSNKYKEYKVDSALYGSPNKFVVYSNNKVVGVPDIYYNVGVKYMPENPKGAYLRANLHGVGSYFADDANSISVPAYNILNAGIGVDHLNFANDKIYVNAFFGLNNLTDKKYVASAWLNPDYLNGKPAFIEPGLPRNFFGSLSLGWNF